MGRKIFESLLRIERAASQRMKDMIEKPVIKYSIKKKADGDTDGVYLLK